MYVLSFRLYHHSLACTGAAMAAGNSAEMAAGMHMAATRDGRQQSAVHYPTHKADPLNRAGSDSEQGRAVRIAC